MIEVPVGLLILAIALSIAAPRMSAAARTSYAAAKVSPLWLLLGVLVIFVPGVDLERESDLLIVAALQAIPAGWLLFRHRRWPWSVLLLAIAVYVATVVAMYVKAVTSHGLIAHLRY